LDSELRQLNLAVGQVMAGLSFVWSEERVELDFAIGENPS
jgi:hypothetical protein